MPARNLPRRAWCSRAPPLAQSPSPLAGEVARRAGGGSATPARGRWPEGPEATSTTGLRRLRQTCAVPILGAHVDSSGGLHLAFPRAAAMGAQAIQVHPTPPHYWGSPKLDDDRVERFREAAAEAG